MECFKDLYDEFRMGRTSGNVSEEKTEKEVDFIYEALKLYNTAKVLDLFCGAGRHSIELSKRGCKPVEATMIQGRRTQTRKLFMVSL